jgi:predicted transcriptional regulator
MDKKQMNKDAIAAFTAKFKKAESEYLSLKEQRNKTILRAYSEGHTVTEIATAFEMKQQTVSMILRRANTLGMF